MKLFYDTETTGFPKNGKPDDHPDQPHLVELGLKLTDDVGNLVQCASMIVKPDGWTIPEEASNVHGITTAIALARGIPEVLVLALFTNLRALADEMIAHNEVFDDRIMRIALARQKRTSTLPIPKLKTCTVILAAPVVNLPPTAKMIASGFNKPKPPNLTECVKFFFDEDFSGAHRALADVEQCARVYWEIRRRQPGDARASTYDLDQYKEKESA